MNRFWHFAFYLLIIVAFLNSCKDSSKNTSNAEAKSIEDSLGIQYPDTTYPLDNEYTRIKNSLCDTIGFDDLKYTNANTQIISLDPLDSLQRFIFISETDCGFPSGNCGKIIELIERKKNNGYQSLIKVCGLVDTIFYDQKQIIYSTFARHQYALDCSKRDIRPRLRQINGMPVEDIQYLGQELNVLEDNFIPKGSPSDNADAIALDCKIKMLSPGLYLRVYELEFQDEAYVFAIISKEEKQLQKFGGKGRFRDFNIENAHALLKLEQSGKLQTWEWKEGKKIFSRKS